MVAAIMTPWSMSPTSFPVAKRPNKSVLPSVRHLALTATLPLSLLCAGRAEAITTITQKITNQTADAFSNLAFSTTNSGTTNPRYTSSTIRSTFNKFDTNLGTLVAVRFTGNGDLLGSFRGARSSDQASPPAPIAPSSLAQGFATLGVKFTNGPLTWDTDNTEGLTTFIGSKTLTKSSSADLNKGDGGVVLTADNKTLNLEGTDNGTYFSLFEGLPGQTVFGDFTWTLGLVSKNVSTSGTCDSTTIRCTGFNFSPNGLTTDQTPLRGDINEFTLSYDYQPFGPPKPIPTPLPILGSGVAFAYTRRLRRRIQKARITH